LKVILSSKVTLPPPFFWGLVLYVSSPTCSKIYGSVVSCEKILEG
jgi:hypothetical protein